MNRRSFVGTLGLGLLTAPLGIEAQQPATIFRLGLLGTVPLSELGSARIWAGFFEGLQQLGYVEGKNIIIESRFSEGNAQRLSS